MTGLIFYFVVIASTFVFAFREYSYRLEEISSLRKEVIKLGTEQQLLMSTLAENNDRMTNLINSSTTINISFYVLVGTFALVILGVCFVYLSQLPEQEVSEVVAKNLPEVTKISTDTTLNAIENATVPLADKLHSMESGLERLSNLSIDLGVKCGLIDSKVNTLLSELGAVNNNVPVDLIAQISQHGVFGQ